MTFSKDEIVGVFTVRDATGTTRQFGLALLVKVTATSFFQTDLAGTWRVYGLSTPQTPGVQPFAVLGKLPIDGSGALTTLTLPDGTVETFVVGSRLTLGTDGLLTGTVTSPDGSVTTIPQATMSPDKNMVVGVGTDTGAPGDPQFGLLLLVRDEPFAVSDLAGTWSLFELSLSASQGNLGVWELGTVTFNSAGTAIAGTSKDPSGNVITFTGGSLNLNNGFLAGTLTTSPSPSSLAVVASGVPSKDMIVGIDLADLNPVSGSFSSAGLFALVKQPPPTLAVSATTVGLSGPLTVTFSNGPGGGWIGLFPLGSGLDQFVDYQYVSGSQMYTAQNETVTSGTVTLPSAGKGALAAGAYVVRWVRQGVVFASSGTLTVANIPPAPVLTALTPPSVVAGTGAVTVHAGGSGFTPASVIQVNGTARATTYNSATDLSVSFSATEVGTANTSYARSQPSSSAACGCSRCQTRIPGL